MSTGITKPSNLETLLPEERTEIYDRIARRGEEIAREFGLEEDQIEVNTTPTGSTWVLSLYIKDEPELRKLLAFMKANDMVNGFE